MEPHPAAAAGGGGGEGEAGRGADPDTGLEGSMWRMGLAGDGGGEGDGARLPERPDQADCIYYLRTGACGFGDRCRYNHPRDRGGTEFGGGAKNAVALDYPERLGQPVCEYYMKTGTCKFGSNCKYHHPKQDGSVQPVMLNSNGFPLRPVRKSAPTT
ncbi:unnamed protein product [Triticum turgidum subsp. durum]|uniref:C3H1-type domain-containing protein n=1 Tax=Triticum turgidum subsp. durum TaxID=4567 RepID=A0A9R1S0X1_TRITD|nr:unnamed protein product [Triticum turgidum subsp. durum]